MNSEPSQGQRWDSRIGRASREEDPDVIDPPITQIRLEQNKGRGRIILTETRVIREIENGLLGTSRDEIWLESIQFIGSGWERNAVLGGLGSAAVFAGLLSGLADAGRLALIFLLFGVLFLVIFWLLKKPRLELRSAAATLDVQPNSVDEGQQFVREVKIQLLNPE